MPHEINLGCFSAVRDKRLILQAMAPSANYRHRLLRYAVLSIDSPSKQPTMKAHTDRFRASSNMQDRIKLPRVFWAGLKSIGLTPGTVLRRSNLPPTVYSGESFVTTAQNFSIWQAIRELSNDPTIGWKFMSQVETEHYHPTLVAALCARAFRASVADAGAERVSTCFFCRTGPRLAL